MKFFLCLLFISSWLMAAQLTNNTITFFVLPVPTTKLITIKNPLASISKLASKAPLKIIRSKTPPISNGIFSTYYGYLDLSSFEGEFNFPLKTVSPSFKLIITPMLKPIMMLGNTIHHWELIDNVAAEFYSLERIYDEVKKNYFWKTEKLEKPSKPTVKLSAIVIFANPKDIFVPTGLTLTNDNPQLQLPTIYAKQTINRINSPLSLIKVRQFFGPLYYENKKLNDTYYAQQLITQPPTQ